MFAACCDGCESSTCHKHFQFSSKKNKIKVFELEIPNWTDVKKPVKLSSEFELRGTKSQPHYYYTPLLTILHITHIVKPTSDRRIIKEEVDICDQHDIII